VGDVAAFREFYRDYCGRVLMFFTRRTWDTELAVDLMSETFTVALEQRGQFRGTSPEEEQGWLFAIARTQLSRHRRRSKAERDALARVVRDGLSATSADIDRIEELADLARLRAELNRAIGVLPVDQSRAVCQRIVEERSYADLSLEFGVTEQVVRARVSRGLDALAGSLHRLRVETPPERPRAVQGPTGRPRPRSGRPVMCIKAD
jgi:RNA polymerase sigma factor (sigma-70 family)